MEENLLPTLVVMRRELQLLTKVVAKLTKSQGQQLKEGIARKKQAALILGCSIRTLDKLISSGSLPITRVGGLIFIKIEDIERLLNDNYVDRSSMNLTNNFNTKKND